LYANYTVEEYFSVPLEASSFICSMIDCWLFRSELQRYYCF